jgi:hypothetical protein
MPDHNPKIKILTDEELAFAIKACEDKSMWPIVACLRELCLFREQKREAERQLRDAFDDYKVHAQYDSTRLKYELEKDRKARSQL